MTSRPQAPWVVDSRERASAAPRANPRFGPIFETSVPVPSLELCRRSPPLIQSLDMGSGDFTREQRSFLENLSRLATANPFLPGRIELDREMLKDDFEHFNPVWSKRLDRQNPNVVNFEARANAMANPILT